MRYPLCEWQTFYPAGPCRIYGLRSIRSTRPVNLGHVTMLRATPYVLHFKRVLDFGERHQVGAQIGAHLPKFPCVTIRPKPCVALPVVENFPDQSVRTARAGRVRGIGLPRPASFWLQPHAKLAFRSTVPQFACSRSIFSVVRHNARPASSFYLINTTRLCRVSASLLKS